MKHRFASDFCEAFSITKSLGKESEDSPVVVPTTCRSSGARNPDLHFNKLRRRQAEPPSRLQAMAFGSLTGSGPNRGVIRCVMFSQSGAMRNDLRRIVGSLEPLFQFSIHVFFRRQANSMAHHRVEAARFLKSRSFFRAF